MRLAPDSQNCCSLSEPELSRGLLTESYLMAGTMKNPPSARSYASILLSLHPLARRMLSASFERHTPC